MNLQNLFVEIRNPQLKVSSFRDIYFIVVTELDDTVPDFTVV